MSPTLSFGSPTSPGSSRLITWPRLKLWLVVTLLWATFRALSSDTVFTVWLVRCGLVTALGVLAYGAVESWPRRWWPWAPRWVPRWGVQLVAVVLVMPPGAYLSYMLTLGTLNVFALGREYWNGWMVMSFMGVLLGPWIALGALLRQREAFAREQALAFELQRSELERKALDARWKLLQAQIAPHFLFNTLANVRSMVRKTGSHEATVMLDSLIAYLRAAVPKLDAAQTTFEHERQTVCAYLELMRMRMPDRLQFAVDMDEPTLALHCPPLTVLTLVENAVAHGIDPSEEGGRIDVRVALLGQRVQVRVSDTGVGVQDDGAGLGTGLANLRERLARAFGDQAQLQLSPGPTHGTLAQAEFPARHGAPS